VFGLIGLQTTGCIIESGGSDIEEDATITAEWSFKELATNRVTGCPVGFDTVRMVSQPVNAAFAPVGSPIIDLFDCVDGRHSSAPLPPDLYRVHLEVQTDGGSVYAQSLAAYVDVIDQDKTFTATILHDGGYFIFDWAMRGAASNQPLGCGDVPGLDGIEIISTITGTTTAVVDQFNCELGTGVTGGLIAGSYEVSIDAFADGEGALGVAPAIPSSIRDKNQVTDLGLVTIPIDGQ
jgi:hypothetical protein